MGLEILMSPELTKEYLVQARIRGALKKGGNVGKNRALFLGVMGIKNSLK